MKLLFDENLSYRLVQELADLYPGSTHVRDIRLTGSEDEQLWAYARGHGFALVSKDADFYHRSVLRGSPPKVVWLRVGNTPTSEIVLLLRQSYPIIQGFSEDQDASFLVLSR